MNGLRTGSMVREKIFFEAHVPERGFLAPTYASRWMEISPFCFDGSVGAVERYAARCGTEAGTRGG
jgi:hypothetical protein